MTKVTLAPLQHPGLNQPAQAAAEAVVGQYCADLLAEASRIEAAQNTSGSSELTSTMIRDADLILRRGYARRRKTPLLIGAQLVAAVGGFVTGLLTDKDSLKDPSQMVIFVALLTVTVTATVIAVMKEQ